MKHLFNRVVASTLVALSPAVAIQRLNTDIKAVLATSEFRDKLRGMGVQITGDTYARNQQVVMDLDITVEGATS